MTEAFDPYYRWLGIPPREQPPHLYRLLGLELFESNPDVIDAMASRHIEYLQEINDGPHLKQAQQLLNELSAARRCLLNAESKAEYDSTLRATLGHGREPPVAASPTKTPHVPEVTRLRESKKHVQARAKSAGSPGRSKARRSTSGRIASEGTSRSKRPVILAASGLCCLLVLLTVGFWLGLRDGGDNDGLSTRVEDVSVQPPEPLTVPVGQSRYGDQQASTMPDREKVPEPPNGENRGDSADGVPDSSSVTLAESDSASESDIVSEPRPDEPGNPEAATSAMPAASPEPPPAENLLLWLDAADASTVRTSDDQLRGWDDKSSNHYRASVDSDGPGPQLVAAVLDEKPAVRFSGTDWLKLTGTVDLLQDQAEYTFVSVARGVQGTLVSNGLGEADPYSFALAPGVEGFRIGGQERNASSDTSSEFHVRSLVVDADSVRWFVDSQLQCTLDAPLRAIEKANVLRIGCSYRNRHGAESVFQGDLAELIVYGRALADDERLRVEATARAKWLGGSIAEFPFETVDRLAAEGEEGMPAEIDAMEPTEQSEADVTAAATTDPPRSSDAEPATHSREFVVLKPVHMEASAGSQLNLRDDGAILSDGQTKADETYRITLETDIPEMTAILLEALPDDSLPGGGPGLGPGGVFSLAEFSVNVKSQAGSESGQAVTFWPARSEDAPQAKLSNDGDNTTRWTVRRRAERVPVVYIANEPFGDGGLIELTLVQRENLGCFRVSATSASDPWRLSVPNDASEGTDDNANALFVNLGGDTWQDPEGNRWIESKSFVQGSFGHEGGRSVKTDETNNGVFGTAQRGISAFRADVEPGDYEVQLIFSEHWTSEPKSRLFSVFIEQRPVLGPTPGLGFARPYVHPIPRVHVAESPLDIDFQPAHSGATTILNGVIIRRLE